MSVTNAISGIIVIGALVKSQRSQTIVVDFVRYWPSCIASINIVGGFLVTRRMLEMFQK